MKIGYLSIYLVLFNVLITPSFICAAAGGGGAERPRIVSEITRDELNTNKHELKNSVMPAIRALVSSVKQKADLEKELRILQGRLRRENEFVDQLHKEINLKLTGLMNACAIDAITDASLRTIPLPTGMECTKNPLDFEHKMLCEPKHYYSVGFKFRYEDLEFHFSLPPLSNLSITDFIDKVFKPALSFTHSWYVDLRDLALTPSASLDALLGSFFETRRGFDIIKH